MSDRPEWLGTYRVVLHALITAQPGECTSREQSHITAEHASLVHGGTVDDADAEHEYMHAGLEVKPCAECREPPALESGRGLWYIECKACGVAVEDLRLDTARQLWNSIEAKDPCGSGCCLPSGHGGKHEDAFGNTYTRHWLRDE